MAAETLTAHGVGVDIYDAMPSFGRKFLMAGKSGLNISHAENVDTFLLRYRGDARLLDMVRSFGPGDIVHWMNDLGIAAHTGPTGRVFPEMMKASPLLRAWLVRLQEQGVRLHPRHCWRGWDAAGALEFDTPGGAVKVIPDAVVLALGGASWKRLGSDGAWARLLAEKGETTAPFGPSNCGFLVNWSDHVKDKFAGEPVKSVRLWTEGPFGTEETRSEFVVTQRGVESGGIYTLSSALLDSLGRDGEAILFVDLLPAMDGLTVMEKLSRPRAKQSMANHLRKSLNLSGLKLALMHEATGGPLPAEPGALAKLIKAVPVLITGAVSLDEAISTTGGVEWRALDDALMLRGLPGVFCAGEMIDWDAPTGGYLITACLATGRAAGAGAAKWLAQA